MPTKVIVPTVPPDAFDPLRPPSGLLRSQIQQLQRAVYDAVDSEGEAALCIRTLTQLLEQLRPQIVPRAHLETARRRKPARSTRTRKAAPSRRAQETASRSRRTRRTHTRKKR